MELKRIEYDLTVCKVKDISDIDMTANFILLEKRMKNYPWFAKLLKCTKRYAIRSDSFPRSSLRLCQRRSLSSSRSRIYSRRICRTS